MSKDNPKYDLELNARSQGTTIGDCNIIFNYFAYKEEIQFTHTHIDSEVDNLSCPYRGLFHFRPDDGDLFFGRNDVIDKLIKATRTNNFIPILGASGSGKSSVVLAGLVPALEKSTDWKFTYFRPGDEPFHALAQALVPLCEPKLNSTEKLERSRHLAKLLSNGSVPLKDVFGQIENNYANQRILLIADQFEELYTLCSEEKSLNSFLDILLDCFKSPPSNLLFSPVLVVTMRADFLGRALEHPPLANVLNADIKLGAMNREQLHRVIEKPATSINVHFEPGLVDRILDDVSNEPGNLALLEFALTELWQNKSDYRLTHNGYESIGKVKGALAKYAEDVYARFSEQEKEQIKNIFLKLVHLGDNNNDTRKKIHRDQVSEENWELVTRKHGLADSRLVVTSCDSNGQETLEIVHEALIHNWQILRFWLDQNRDRLHLIQEIEAQADKWKRNRQNLDDLLRGTSLARAEEIFHSSKPETSSNSHLFIRESIKQRNLEQEKIKRRNRRTFAVLTCVLLAVSTMAIALTWQLRRASIKEINALTSSAESLLASKQELDALVAALKAGSKIKASALGVDQKTKYRLIGTLQNIFPKVHESNRLNNIARRSWKLRFSRNDKYLVVDGQNATATTIYDTEGRNIEEYMYVAFSSDEQIVASELIEGTIELRDLNGKFVHRFDQHDGKIVKLEFTPNDQMLVSMDEKHNIKLWNLQGQLIRNIKINSDSFFWAISPNSQLIATSDDQGNIQIRNIPEKTTKTIKGHGKALVNLGFAPNSKFFFAEYEDEVIKIWNINGDLLSKFSQNTDRWYKSHLERQVFSPDSQTFVSVDSQNKITVWNNTDKSIYVIEDKIYFESDLLIKFSSDSKTFLIFDQGKSLSLWNTKGQLVQGYASNMFSKLLPKFKRVSSIDFDPNSKLITIRKREGKKIEVRDLSNKLIVASDRISPETTANFSQDGKLIGIIESEIKQEDIETHGIVPCSIFEEKSKASSSTSDEKFCSWDSDGKVVPIISNRIVRLFNSEGKLLHTFSKYMDDVRAITFSPDNKTIISFHRPDLDTFEGGYKMLVWSLNGEFIKQLSGEADHPESYEPYYAPFSHDGSKYALYSTVNKEVTVWDLHSNLPPKFLYTNRDDTEHLSFSSDGKTLASMSRNGTINLWNLEDKLIPFYDQSLDLSEPNLNLVNAFFSTLDNNVALKNENNLIQYYDTKGKLIFTLRSSNEDFSMWYETWHVSENNIFLTRLNNGRINICVKNSYKNTEISKNMHCNELENQGSSRDTNLITTSPDHKILIAYDEKNNTLKVWNIDGKLLVEIFYFKQTSKGRGVVDNVYFNSNEKIFTINNGDGRLRFWNYEGEIVETLESRINNDDDYYANKNLNLAAFPLLYYNIQPSRNRELFIISDKSDEKPEILISKKGELQHILKCLPNYGCMMAFDSQSKPLIIAYKDNLAKIFTLDWQLLFTLDGVDEPVGKISFSPDGKTIISIKDSLIKIWNEQGVLLRSIKKDIEYSYEHHNALPLDHIEISSDGQYIAILGKFKTINLLNLNGESTTLQGHTDEITDVKFSKDSNILVTTSRDATVRLWNMKGELLSTFRSDAYLLSSVDISPDGKILVAYSYYANMDLWSLDLDHLLAKGCDWAKDYIENSSFVNTEDSNICANF